MGSKGTSTQTQAGTSTYTPSAATQAAGTQALTAAQSAASSPFQLPVAPVAGFTPDQLQAFQQTQQQQGIAQPYFDQSQQLFNQSAAPITGAQVNQYMNPYSSYVLQNLANTQGQQMNQLTGQATQQAGGVGADRIGVAQGELANQQNLATGQTLSGIYGSALSAAQQNAQMQQSAAYGIGNLGGAVQNAATQGTQNLYNMGSQQQQLNQAQLNAPYQNQLAQIAFPYQNAQYLAGITGSLAGALGGTTQSNQYGTAQAAPPSILSQIAGAGTAAAGAYGVYNSLGGNGTGGTPGSAISGATGPTSYGGSAGPMPLVARGGRIEGFASGGDTTGSGEPAWMTADPTIPMEALHAPQVVQPKIQPLNMGSGSAASGTSDLSNIANIAGSVAKLAPLLLSHGGAVDGAPYQAFADGGETQDYIPQDFESRFRDAATMGQIERPRFAESPTLGEMPRAQALAHYLRDPDASVARNDSPVGVVANPDQPYRMPPPAATQAWRDGTPVPEADDTPPNATPTAGTVKPTGMAALSPGAAATADANRAAMQGATVNLPYPDLDHTNNTSRDITRSPWLALMNAGFGMMAGTSPYAGINIGKGAQAGTETLMKQREADKGEEEINQRAKQLAMQADQHLREWTQLKPGEAVTAENTKAQQKIAQDKMEQEKWQIVYDPKTGTPFWTKQGEKPVPALPGSAPPVTSTAPAAGTAPPVAPAPPNNPADISYKPPSTDQSTGPGPIFNPKTGVLAADQVQQSNKVVEDARAKGSAAADAAIQLGHLKQAFNQLDALQNEAGGFLKTGAYATQRFAIAKTINGILTPLGVEPIDPALIGSAEEAAKITTRLGQAQARLLGAREATQVINQSIEANPGVNNTPEGRRYILATMDAAIKRQQEFSQFVNDYRKQWRSASGAEQEFNRLNPPDKYVIQAGIASAPPAFQTPQAVQGAVATLRAHKDDPAAVALFNKIYHGTASYFLKDAQ